MATTEKEIEEAAKEHWDMLEAQPSLSVEEIHNEIFKAGWKANPVQYTEEDVLIAIKAAERRAMARGVLYDMSEHIKEEDKITPEQWLQEYKQQKENGK